MASIAHTQALQSWSKSNKANAIVQITRAVNLETKEHLLARHLLFKGEIEWTLGQREESLASLNEAKRIVEKHSSYWSKTSNIISKNRLKHALEKHV